VLAIWGLGLAAVLGVGVSPVRLGGGSHISVAAIRRLPPGKLFTTDQWAEYLIYARPSRRVFFDGRNDFYGPAFVQTYLTILKAQPGWEQILTRYRVSVVLVPARSSISAALDYAFGWRQLYSDRDEVVFVRQDPVGRRCGASG
jgi:hypothetical protein